MSHFIKKLTSFFFSQSDSLILDLFRKLIFRVVGVAFVFFLVIMTGLSYLVQHDFEKQLVQVGMIISAHTLAQPNLNLTKNNPEFFTSIRQLYPVKSIYLFSLNEQNEPHLFFDIINRHYLDLHGNSSKFMIQNQNNIEFKRISQNVILFYTYHDFIFLESGKIFVPVYYGASNNIDEFGGNIPEAGTTNKITGYLEITLTPIDLQLKYYGIPGALFLCFSLSTILIFTKNYKLNQYIIHVLNQYLSNTVHEVISSQSPENIPKETRFYFKEFNSLKGQLFKLNKFIKKQKVEREKADSASYQSIENLKNKEQYFANVLHELRNPINIFNGFLELLGSTKITKNQREYLQHMQVSNRVVHQLINDLLDLSKMNVGKFTLRPERVHFYEVLYEIVSTHILQATKKNLELLFDFDQNLPLFLIADRIRLHQIMTNLITNAIKFTEEGCIFVRVRLSHQNEFYLYVQFEIQDQGIGISKDDLKKLFRPFEQVQHGEKSYLGTGLGLVICSKLIEQMHGTIHAESMEGQGTTIFFTLKLQKCEVQDSYHVRYGRQMQLHQQDQFFYYSTNNTLTNWLRSFLSFYNIQSHQIRELDHTIEQFEMHFHAETHQNVNHILLVDFNKSDLNTTRLKEFFKLLDILINGFEHIQLYLVLYIYSIDKALFYQFLLQEMPHYPQACLFTLCFLEKPLDYQKFFTLMNTIRAKSVKNILENVFNQQNNAEIEWQGESNHLTSAKLSLPTLSSERNETHPIVTQPDYHALKVLIVDDHELNRQLLVSLLQHDYQLDNIDQVVDGMEAVNHCQQRHYDIIFMDIQMPNMDGLTATKMIRTIEKERNEQALTYIIGLTANNFGMNDVDYHEIGMNQCLLKPFSRDVFNTILNERLTILQGQHQVPPILQLQGIQLAQTQSDHLTEMPPFPVLDREKGIELSMNNEAAWKQAIQMLWEMLPLQKNKIHQYYVEQDWQKMRRAVHQLHGATSYCGTLALKEALRTLENALIKNQLERVPTDTDIVFQEIEKLLNISVQELLNPSISHS